MNILLSEVKLSIELEEKGYEFYKTTSLKTKNPLASATLSSLAERELVHINRIKEFYKKITGDQSFTSTWITNISIIPTRAQLLKPILEKLKTSLSKTFETQEDINKAYKIAEGLETDSFNLYSKIASETTDDSAKKLYGALAAEEKEHYAILDETLQYLNNPGDWFKKEERWIVEG